jgi:hypothetical protein
VIRPARLRETEVLAAQLAISSAECGRDGPRFCFGVRDALRWLIRGGPAPLTGTPSGVPVPCAAIVHELGAAEAAIHPRGSSLGQYAEGVEHALMWAQLVTPAPPEPAVTSACIEDPEHPTTDRWIRN